MKHFSKLLGVTLTAAALLLTACTKKPARPDPGTTTLGPQTNDMVNPDQIALPGETINLDPRDSAALDGANLSVVDPIYFALDRYAVAPAERPKLDAVIKWLQENPGKNLVLIGYCDWRGTAEYNLGLGENRANSVKRFLEAKGADVSRLETLSKGSTEAKQGGSESEWAKDRRVDFVELKKQ